MLSREEPMRVPDDDAAPWQATAAYLYVLRLDPPALAWEYLRRDPAYRACWRRFGRRAGAEAARPWGLARLADPDRDARRAHPVWNASLPSLLHLYAANGQAGAGLDLWHVVTLMEGVSEIKMVTDILEVEVYSLWMCDIYDTSWPWPKNFISDVPLPVPTSSNRRCRAASRSWKKSWGCRCSSDPGKAARV